jgi:hypothetical protein
MQNIDEVAETRGDNMEDKVPMERNPLTRWQNIDEVSRKQEERQHGRRKYR